LEVYPDGKYISIDNKHIWFFGKDNELKWVNFDGSGERTICKFTDTIYPITIHKGVFYYGKYNWDSRAHIIYSFDVKSGKEVVVNPLVHNVAYDSQYMYMLEKKTENRCCVHQFHFDSQKQITPWEGIAESAYKLGIQDDNLICYCECPLYKKKRIAEIEEPYGIATKEECEKAGFFDTFKDTKSDDDGKGFGVKLLENRSLVYWKEDYSENIEIMDNCDAYKVIGSDIYYSPLDYDGKFGKFNVETGENFKFDIKVAWDKEDEHSFAFLDNTLYFRVWTDPCGLDGYDKRKKLYFMDLKDKNVQVVPYEFDKEICNVVNYNGCIYVQEGFCDKNIIYGTEAGKWSILLKNVEAYCFDRDDIYYVKEEAILSNYRAGNHSFYRMNLSSKEEKKIGTAGFTKSQVADDGTGYMKKIWIEDGKLMYLERNLQVQPEVKEIKL
jgi:hypothetical protein